MKISKVRRPNGETVYGAWDAAETALNVIEGDLFGQWNVTDRRIERDDVERILPPLAPPNVFAIGLNYRAHAEESKLPLPKAPVIFIKATSAVIGHEDPVLLPKPAPDEVDWEAELVLVIGRTAREVSEADAFDYLFGYTLANDVSARDCQVRLDMQWARSKSFDTFCPLGPCIQTEGDPDNLRIQARIDGQTMQDSNTNDLIFNCRHLISYLSHQFTLHPGTVILTGTPAGVGYGMNPQRYLRDGETVEVELENVGVLRNPVKKA